MSNIVNQAWEDPALVGQGSSKKVNVSAVFDQWQDMQEVAA